MFVIICYLLKIILFDVLNRKINSFPFKYILTLFTGFYLIFFHISIAPPGNATEHLMAQGTFKIRSGQVGTQMIQNDGVQSDPNREFSLYSVPIFIFVIERVILGSGCSLISLFSDNFRVQKTHDI